MVERLRGISLRKTSKLSFGQLRAVDLAYCTDCVEANFEGVVETLTQWAVIAATAFGYVHRLWRLREKGNVYMAPIRERLEDI